MHSHRLELDLHRLDLRFAASRLVEPTAVDRIAHSIERCGQIVPCIVVAAAEASGADAEHLVLIDGYPDFRNSTPSCEFSPGGASVSC